MTAVLHSDKLTVIYGSKTIGYSLFYAERKTMEIAVHPDSTVTVKAPMGSDIVLIEKKINKRARWILRQLNYFKQFTPKTPSRCFINGETHLYLGKQYRLKIYQGDENSVKLSKGFFQITCRKPGPEVAERLLKKWYLERANIQLNNSLSRCWSKFSSFVFAKPVISIRQMQKRWGSLSSKGIVTLNPDLIKAPKECIDYVVTHELCHLKYHDHSSEFYKLLNRVIPEWERVKRKLELSMV
ncbi:MAG: M48 family metallopeptidase [Gammaproteobacteria bacterium]|nr:M48 family metallopeptidase [Gammaproteobacteria bacterium]